MKPKHPLLFSIFLFFTPQSFATKFVDIGPEKVFEKSVFVLRGKIIKTTIENESGEVLCGRAARTGPGLNNTKYTHVEVKEVVINKGSEKVPALIKVASNPMRHLRSNKSCEEAKSTTQWTPSEDYIFLVYKFKDHWQYTYPMHAKFKAKDIHKSVVGREIQKYLQSRRKKK